MSTAAPTASTAPTVRRGWPRAYRPLRPLTLLVQLGVLVVAEVGLYASYAAHDARFHWATHFLVALLLTAVWQAVHLLVAARPARGQLLTIVVFHLWAMWPDLAFRAGLPHYRWMDWLALGHIQVHYMPGGDRSWLVLALLAVAGYVLLLSRWVEARRSEAATGMPPALGIGGRAVIRPQLDPRGRPLAHEHLMAAETADGQSSAEPMLLVPGLGGTSSTWLAAGRLLAAAGHPVLAPDLLGFGASMRLGTRFRLDDQADAVLRLMDHHDIDQVHLVGHSWGCVVAAAVAARAPGRVSRLTLVAPAAFADPAEARARMARESFLARTAFAGEDLGGLVCNAMCISRPLLSRIMPRLKPRVPVDVVRGGVQHSYPAYRDALTSMWQDNPLPALLRAPTHPVTVVLADSDETVHPNDVLRLPVSDEVDAVRVEGTHGLPYEQPDMVARLILTG
ncbi:alpha/beta fold hydrolase [Aquipuribacter hungaricus]|uniref:Alpha/beta fold hydrolase n=1 Tax=Aquipuribacter hungaricus TaxID=545624 RepID=A0ABV7WHC6_9MICO